MRSHSRPRAGFTVLEVVVAMALFLILAVPLAWSTIWTAQGKTWARDVDDAVAVAREEWGTVRRIPAKGLRDTVREVTVGSRSYRVVRTVSDTIGTSPAAVPVLGAPPPPRTLPAVRVCVLHPAGLLDPDDTLRCFAWRVPSTEIQP